MKLYYFPGACSLASHIVVNELALPVDTVRVDLRTKRTENGDEYLKINPEGYVPALALDDGGVLTESPAVLMYLAAQGSPSSIFPEADLLARCRVVEMLAYVSTELHQRMHPLINPASTEADKAAVHVRLLSRMGRLEDRLTHHPFLTGPHFTIADAYAFAILFSARFFGVPLASRPAVQDFMARVAQRRAVAATLKAENLEP